MKKIITTLLAGLVIFTGTAFAVEPEDIFLNYGGGIEQGDMMASVSLGTPWEMFDAINRRNGWGAPSILGEFEYAQRIGPVPFTFGGYLGLDFWGSQEYFNYWYDQYGRPYGSGYYGTVYAHVMLRMGGIVRYHIAVPPVDGLDINLALKLGFNLDMSNAYSNNVRANFDWGLNLGASYFFTDSIGIKVGLGYPYGSVGAIFKF